MAPPDVPDVAGLAEYQATGVTWLRSRGRALLGDEMGLGKTVQALRALPARCRAIVVCPASVILVWRAEAARWRPDLTVTTREGLRRPREGEIVALSYDSLPEPQRGMRQLVTDPLGDVTLILDECHMAKNYRAQRTRKVRMLGRQCCRVWGLTGTPMLGTPPDLWGVLASLGLSDIFLDYEEFVELCDGKPRYMFDRRSGMRRQIGHVWGKVSETVRERLRCVMLRRMRSDVLPELPERRYVDVPVEAPDDLREFLDDVHGKWADVGSSDLPPFELLSEARRALALSRVASALDWVRRLSEEMPLLVFSSHVDPVVAVGQEVDGAASLTGQTPPSMRADLVERFKTGKLRVLAMTIDAGGVGLNLQEAGGVFFIDRDYTPGLNDQAESRAVRPGQKHQCVMVWRMVSDHPLDVRLGEILDEKQRLIRASVG